MDATINFDESAVFVKVIERGSFSGAARELSVPTSTISRRVQRLEDTLGVRLIQRSTRKLTLTDAGAEFFRRVSPAIDAVRAAGDVVRGFTNEPAGTLRITAPTDASGVLGVMMARFVEAHPQVSLDLVITNRNVDLIGEGFDAALRGGRLRDSSLVAVKLLASEFVMVASPAYLRKRGTPKRTEQLAHHDCLIFRPMGNVWPMEGPRGALEIEVQGRITADDFGFLRKAAIAGAGIAYLPEMLARPSVERGRLERVLPRYGYAQSQMHLLYPSAQHLPAKLAVFRDFMVKEFAAFAARSID